jgi:hypothetical protein
MLVLALFFIVVATSLATLIMAGSAQLMRTTRYEHESILIRQLTDSGRAWVLAHKGLQADIPVTLRGEGLLPEGTSGEVRIALDREAPEVFIVTAIVRLSGHEMSRSTRFRTPS